MKKQLTDKQKQFIKELRALLIKYNACVDWTCDEISDTYGLVNDHLVISMHGETDIDLDFACIDADDLLKLVRGDE